MKGLIIATHGDLCFGLKDTYEMVVGNFPENTVFLSLKNGMGVDVFKENFKENMMKLKKCDSYLILVDLEGGSPYNTASEYFYSKDYEGKIEIVTGVNLPILVEAIDNLEDMEIKELANLLLINEAIGVKKAKKIEKTEEEEEF
ncbi:PTS sugar transporter subunit IIA [Fusobacterium sp.]|uniref:PTS sugar transporter subunit IIA n=1 Tax=Fusobacterium sp. TaxID=68766 RepID=UPI002613B521|nr:PTS sugar transporter subunit IIA [Fusobacterium sp.]